MILNPYILGGAFVVLFLTSISAWLHGRDYGLQQYYEFKAKVEEQQHALEKENRELRLVSESVTRDVSIAWDRALRADRNLRVRVLQPVSACSGQGGLRPIPSTPGITPKLPIEEPRFSPSGDVTVAVEECQQRLETAITDAAWIEHVKVWADKQSRIGE